MTEIRDAENHHLFGGILCLDFTNTLYGHGNPIHEYLMDYRDVVLWSRHVEILDSNRAEKLLSEWEQVPARFEAVFHQTIELRETLYRIFASLAHNESAKKDDLTRLHQTWLKNEAHSQLVRTESGFRMGWKEGDAIDSMLWPITRSAVELLTSDELKRVKQCGRCDWLFVDRSRNQGRRWCSMSACGNRVKMARRYKRSKSQEMNAGGS